MAKHSFNSHVEEWQQCDRCNMLVTFTNYDEECPVPPRVAKFVQLASLADGYGDHSLYALDEDGEVWFRMGGDWHLVKAERKGQ